MARNPQFLSHWNGHQSSKWSGHVVFCAFSLPHVLRATTAYTFSTSQLPKVARTCGNFSIFTSNVLRATTAYTFSTSQLPKVFRDRRVLILFTSKRASRYNGVHVFHISTPKSAPNMWCFDTFYFQTCFAPQWRAIFHLSSGQLAPHLPP